MISWLERNRVVSWAITSLIAIFIFYVSSIVFEPSPQPSQTPLLPIIYHISIFFFLAVFLFISSLDRKWNFKKILSAITIVSIYAVLDEIHQYFVPGRFSSMNDFFLNFSGIVFASLLYFVMIAKKNKN